MEFATKIMGTKIILVLGHTRCGAIVGACDNIKFGKLTTLLDKVQPAIALETKTISNRNGNNEQFVNNVTEINVHLIMQKIQDDSDIIRELLEQGKLKIVGGVYDVETGKVTFFEK